MPPVPIQVTLRLDPTSEDFATGMEKLLDLIDEIREDVPWNDEIKEAHDLVIDIWQNLMPVIDSVESKKKASPSTCPICTAASHEIEIVLDDIEEEAAIELALDGFGISAFDDVFDLELDDIGIDYDDRDDRNGSCFA